MNLFEQQAMMLNAVSPKNRTSRFSDDEDFDPPYEEPEYWFERAERDSGMTAKDFK